jgi:uncharacterized protein YpiB (UPF0302 family)
MNPWVSASAKKKWLLWFLTHFRLRKQEAVLLLQNILNNYHLLDKVHLTDQIAPMGRTIVISTVCSEKPPFQFYKGNKVSINVSEALHDLQLHPSEATYLVLHFRGKELNYQFRSLIEPIKTDQIERKKAIQEMLDRSLLEGKVNQLRKKIDDALEAADKQSFMDLSSELKKAQEQLEILIKKASSKHI